MSMPAPRYRFTVDEWHQMIEAGMFRKGQRVELLDGEIYEMAPIGPPHQSIVDRLTHLLVTRFGDRAIVRVQGPITVDRRSEPEPDLQLLRRRDDYYSKAHPGAQQSFLVVEVADSSLDYDHAKLRIYAATGVREVWIVDVRGDRVEVHRTPRDGVFTETRIAERGQQLACDAFPDVALSVDDILG
ncbi:MAG: Uma2 family endonuclease [Candidatus Rokubacteria bacterium]|nr:Uma2 family endonuclease [Candidatus Rokubacteria bacterium]